MSVNKISCTRRLQFCAGHRVFGHENKCGNLHGHNYVVFITAEKTNDFSPVVGVDAIGRVVDFSVLKEAYGNFIDNCWDHGFILNEDDEEAIRAVGSVVNKNQHSKLYLMSSNPTAENMAKWLLDLGPQLMKSAGHEVVIVTEVTVHETENCHATVSLAR